MNRYYILCNPDTLEAIGSKPSDRQPDNSILIDETNNTIRKPIFDKYPNPTYVIEGLLEEEVFTNKEIIIEELRQKYKNKINDYLMIPDQQSRITGIPLSQEVIDGYWALRNEFHEEVFRLTGISTQVN